ncbi:hypothetical protein VTN00DRAFT_650 [Thermoascus crustaceus]|uniref:uncharacterized protein n=1 Tax=Thermoascus crustaceus TaxID=5088 RepID=UPI003742008F
MVLDYPMSITMLLLTMNAEERCRKDEKQNELCTRGEKCVVSSIDRDVAQPPPLPIKLRFIFQTSSLILFVFPMHFPNHLIFNSTALHGLATSNTGQAVFS